MKIKFDSDDKLPLNKTVEIPIATIVVRAVFYENKKNYPQVFFDECMLYYDRIDVSEGIDVNITSILKDCDVFHYWYCFKFQPNVCNRCHHLLTLLSLDYFKFV